MSSSTPKSDLAQSLAKDIDSDDENDEDNKRKKDKKKKSKVDDSKSSNKSEESGNNNTKSVDDSLAAKRVDENKSLVERIEDERDKQASSTDSPSSLIKNASLQAATEDSVGHILRNIQTESEAQNRRDQLMKLYNEHCNVVMTYGLVKTNTVKFVGGYVFLDKLPRFFKINSLTKQVIDANYFSEIPTHVSSAVTNAVKSAREYFKNGTAVTWYSFDPDGYFVSLNDPDVPLSSVPDTTPNYMGSNRSAELAYKRILSKFETFSTLCCNYRFIMKLPEETKIYDVYADGMPGYAQMLEGKYLSEWMNGHIYFSGIYTSWTKYKNELYTLFRCDDVLSENFRPGLGRAVDEPNKIFGLKVSCKLFTTTDQYVAELARLNLQRIRDNKFSFDDYMNYVRANATNGLGIFHDGINVDELMMIQGTNAAGWRRVMGLFILDSNIGLTCYNRLITDWQSRRIFTFRDNSVLIDSFKSDQSSVLITKFVEMLSKMRGGCKEDFVISAIIDELFISAREVRFQHFNFNDDCFETATLSMCLCMICFVLFPRTFWTNLSKIADSFAIYYRKYFPIQYSAVARTGWFVNVNNLAENTLSLGTTYTNSLYKRGYVPRIFFNNRGQPPNRFMNLWGLIRPMHYNVFLDKKQAAGYPYFRNDYMYVAHVEISDDDGDPNVQLETRLNDIIDFGFITLFENYRSRDRIHKLTSNSCEPFIKLRHVVATCIRETAELFVKTVGIVNRDIANSFPFLYDGFDFERPWLSIPYFGLVDNISSFLPRYPIDTNRSVYYYFSFFFSAVGIFPRANSLNNTAAIMTPPTIIPIKGIEMTTLSLDIYRTAELLNEVLYIARGLLDPDIPVLTAFREFFANRRIPASQYSQFLDILTRISGLEYASYFNISLNKISSRQDLRLPNPAFALFDIYNNRVNNWVPYAGQDVVLFDNGMWEVDPTYLPFLSLFDHLIFSPDSPLYSSYVGLIFGVEVKTLHDGFEFTSVSTAYERCQNRVVAYNRSTTFVIDRNVAAAGASIPQLYGNMVMVFTLNDVEYRISDFHNIDFPKFVLTVPYYTDILPTHRPYIEDLVMRHYIYVHMTEQIVNFSYEVITNPTKTLVSFAEAKDLVESVINQGELYLKMYDTKNQVIFSYTSVITPDTVTYLMPSPRDDLSPFTKNVLAKNIIGSNDTADGPVVADFLEASADNWSKGGNFHGEIAVRYPSNNTLKINGTTANFNNVIEGVESGAYVTSYPQLDFDSVGVKL